MKALKDFLWYKAGQEISPAESQENIQKWFAIGLVDSVAFPKAETPKIEVGDLNRDGTVDKEDVSIAASVLKKFGSKAKGGR